MKEAAGEANLTVVAIILIAVVVAVATPLINSLMKTSANKACCTDAGGVWSNGTCSKPKGDTTGQYKEEDYKACVSGANSEVKSNS